ncbi:MAG: DUF3857 domain-containing protein [Candidatus Kapabacteria bacterium]|nr:DUF3857 domain-containing protein [Candidatus Kapabacteria bacterium]
MVAAKEEWIEDREDFPEDLLHAESQYSYLLTEYQIRYSSGCLKTYKKMAIRINSYNDFSNANPLQISIDDSNETWNLHSVLVYRSGTIVKKTDTVVFSELQRETGLEENVITGTKTFVAHVHDLKIGDIICYEYTVTNTDPIYTRHFEYFLHTSFTVPLYHFRLTVHYNDRHKTCAYRTYNGLHEVERGNLDESGVFVYERRAIDAVILEDNIPNHRSPAAHVEFSDYTDWAEFGLSMLPFYQSDEYSSIELNHYAQSIVAECADTQHAIEALVRHVQKNVGYLSLSLNEHSYVPHSPTNVSKTNYGDCKDKTLFLKTLLKTQGVESTAVLVHSAFSKDTPNRLPCLGCFNHVILSIEYGGVQYLVDPTNQYDCFTLEHCAEPWYQSGLFLNHAPSLQEFKDKKNSVYSRNVVEHFTIRGDMATLNIRDEYRYLAFPGIAHRQVSASRDVCKKSYIDYYAKRYSSISYDTANKDGGEYAYTIDEDRHCLTITTCFTIPSFWTIANQDGEERKKAAFFPGDLMEVLHTLHGTNRTFPCSWSHKAECNVRFIIDYDFTATMGSLDENIQTDIFSYIVTTTDRKQTYTYDIAYKSKSDVIEAADYASVQKVVNQLVDTLGLVVTRPAPTPQPVAAADDEDTGMSTSTKVGIFIAAVMLLRYLFSM